MKKLTVTSAGAMIGLSLGSILFALGAPRASAATIIDEWTTVKIPPAPTLKTAEAGRDTALLLLDFSGAQDPSKGPCNAPRNPRCIATLPNVKNLLDKARAAGLLVVWSIAGPVAKPSDIATAIAPGPNDPVVHTFADKFVKTDLDKILAARNIKTLIVTGTAAEGAVLDTATDGIFRGFNIILPVDGMSSPEPYAEQYVAWHMSHAPSVAAKTTLTRSDMIKFP